MHPADVAEFVAAAVDDLGERLTARSDLRAGPPVLEDEVRLFVPFSYESRRLVQHAVPSGLVLPGEVPTASVWTVPDLGAPTEERHLTLYLDLTDFDGQPPTAELLRDDRTPLPAAEWPHSLGKQAIVRNHRDFNRPFFCRPGLREFHTHPQHEDEPWDKYREGRPLHSIVIELLELLEDRHSWSTS